MLDSIAKHLDAITVVSGTAVFLSIWLRNALSRQRSQLDDLISRSLAGSAIPTGLILLLCAFKPDLLLSLEGLNMYIAAAGLVLIFVSCRAIFEGPLRPLNDKSKTDG